jgi:Phage tail tube protein, GTA-gp10
MARKSKAPTLKTFFGDAERDFTLTPTLIVELERVTGAGIGALAKRLFAGQFKHADMLETIRLALIGGGETPQVAASLVLVYAAERPINEVLPVAVAILETAFFGVKTPARAEGD